MSTIPYILKMLKSLLVCLTACITIGKFLLLTDDIGLTSEDFKIHPRLYFFIRVNSRKKANLENINFEYFQSRGYLKAENLEKTK